MLHTHKFILQWALYFLNCKWGSVLVAVHILFPLIICKWRQNSWTMEGVDSSDVIRFNVFRNRTIWQCGLQTLIKAWVAYAVLRHTCLAKVFRLNSQKSPLADLYVMPWSLKWPVLSGKSTIHTKLWRTWDRQLKTYFQDHTCKRPQIDGLIPEAFYVPTRAFVNILVQVFL